MLIICKVLDMTRIKKVSWVLAIILWFITLSLLIIALTDLVPNNSLKEYRFFIGIMFITISGFIRNTLVKLSKQDYGRK